MDPFATPGRAPRGAMGEQRAVEIAAQALGFVAADEDRIGAFLAQTGADPGEIRALAGDPGFLAGVLDFVLAADDTLLAFCEENALAPETVHGARHILAPEDSGY